jgi:hypothetical protein
MEDLLAPLPPGGLAERAAALLGRLHGACYGDPAAVALDLDWLERQGFLARLGPAVAAAPRPWQPVQPPPWPAGSPRPPGGLSRLADRDAFGRVFTLLRHLLHHPFDTASGTGAGAGAGVGVCEHLARSLNDLHQKATPPLPGCWTWRQVHADLTDTLTPYGFRLAGSSGRHGYALGTALLSLEQEWLRRLNRWLNENWRELGGSGEAPRLALPSESQWEVACRGDAKPPTPFHFGATLDASWARYDASKTFGKGRKGAKFKQPWSNGSSGLVNRWGLAELHGQLSEWCADLWNRDPRLAVQRPRRLFGGKRNAEVAPMADGPVDQLDPALKGNLEQRYRLLRGGSWVVSPRRARAAFRFSYNPDFVGTFIGMRPCCPSPPGSLLGP